MIKNPLTSKYLFHIGWLGKHQTGPVPEIVRIDKRGRPPKVLRKGVKVRIKNKGSKTYNGDSKKPRYEAPHREHPETKQDISNSDIHAEHAEAFNSSTRRRNSAYRRRTNTYAKKRTALQRTLDMLWVIYNFIRPHFTTRKVPAVALGIIKKRLSWKEALMTRIFDHGCGFFSFKTGGWMSIRQDQCPLSNLVSGFLYLKP